MWHCSHLLSIKKEGSQTLRPKTLFRVGRTLRLDMNLLRGSRAVYQIPVEKTRGQNHFARCARLCAWRRRFVICFSAGETIKLRNLGTRYERRRQRSRNAGLRRRDSFGGVFVPLPLRRPDGRVHEPAAALDLVRRLRQSGRRRNAVPAVGAGSCVREMQGGFGRAEVALAV